MSQATRPLTGCRQIITRQRTRRRTRRIQLIGQRLGLRLAFSIRQSAAYSRANMKAFALFEVVGQPLYYLLWHFTYPQPYENIPLRILCMLMAVPMFFEARISRYRAERLLNMYWILFLLFDLPFFFVYMMLRNDLSTLWAISTMSAVMILVIVIYDWLMSLLLAISGLALAYLLFVNQGGEITSPPLGLTPLLWIYAFGLAAGSAFNYQTELVAREKLSAITDAVGTKAHELRTPLLGIRSGARGLHQYLPALIPGYRLARDNELAVPRIRRVPRLPG